MKAPAAGNTRATICAGGRRPAAGDTIIDDRWTVGNDKEGSVGQEQTTTNHCALKAGERWPAERAAGDKKGKDDANEEDE